MVNWDHNAKLIAGLWPQYAPTPEEKALYAERLGHRRQDWLEEALKRHRSEDHDGAFKPRLSRIIAHYDQIRESGDDKREGPKQNERHEAVTWEQVEADDQAMTADILGWPGERVAAAVAYVATLDERVMGTKPVKEPETDPRKWTRFLRGMVWAADERLRRPQTGRRSLDARKGG